ncbi:aromatic ring-hydroxylating dioxygenase subunit alpha [Nocardioides sp. GY 10127]|uniref:aromatic ring-hydroxylating oxygenase subunit alpha n=1 Tax=Nocardioides sp. GY 10127 TaxID=2569762 RepID=UPI0010A8998A|nr:aromatic ring-hydroxylating dioxygenase subunit alpha [Nocardioides sp. GY 10127]TIC81918.1 aromatic ring-hydroxylating dioxygenase subunit alpha [Nocardioides sp. GY 10127]
MSTLDALPEPLTETTAGTTPALAPMAADYRPGWALPSHAFSDPRLHARELDTIWSGTWLFCCPSADLAEPGDRVAWTIEGDSVLVVRQRDGSLRGFVNVCRHRGCRIADDGRGEGRGITCPYHEWVYALDGSLRGTPHMGTEVRHARDSLGLLPVAVAEVAGLVYVNSDAEASFPQAFADALTAHVGRYRVEETEVVARHTYRVAANWKLLVENNRECYHCAANHEEFCLSNFDLGMSGDTRTSAEYVETVARQEALWAERGLPVGDVSFPDGEFFRVARLPLREGFVTETLSGQPAGPLLGDLTDAHVGSIRIVTLPNSWCHVNADYVMTTRLTPVDPGTTDIEVVFCARPGGEVDVEGLTRVWVATSEQDWALCERNARGIADRGYRPGPLSPVIENSVAAFHEWWLRAIGLPDLADASEAARPA